mgnify:CR=1 FL=1
MQVSTSAEGELQSVLDLVGSEVDRVKRLLETNQISDLEQALLAMQQALERLHAWGGGLDGLARFIKSLPEDRRTSATAKLEHIRLTQDINSELVRLAMQRNAALQSYAAQTRADATYSNAGGVPLSTGGDLIGKF